MGHHRRHGHSAPPRPPAPIHLPKAPPSPPEWLPGTPGHVKALRKDAAKLIREIRAMWPRLRSHNWTRRTWNDQARNSGRGLIEAIYGYMPPKPKD